MYFKLGLFLLLFFSTNYVDHVRIECKMKLGRYADRDIFISKTNVCYVKNYDIYIDVDSFMSAAVRVL